ncbi:putative ribonuclease H-like domain-containing protein [Tanacetum coccineum]
MSVRRVVQGFRPRIVARTTTYADGTSTSTIPGPLTAEERILKRNDVKAKSILLMAIPNEHQLTFNQYKDAKTFFEAIQSRFGVNDATKKTQKTLLKQTYENFNASNCRTRGEGSVSSSSTHKSLESWHLYQLLGITNMMICFHILVSTASTPVSAASTSDNAASLSDATIYASWVNKPHGSQIIHEDLEQIHDDDLEEMNLKWQLALLQHGARRLSIDGKKSSINGRCFIAEEEVLTNMALMDFSDSEVDNQLKKGLGYNVVPPPPTGLFIPPSIDLSHSGIEKFKEPEVVGYRVKLDKIVSEISSVETKKNQMHQLLKIGFLTVKRMRLWYDKCVGKQGVLMLVKPQAMWFWRPKIKGIDHVSKASGSTLVILGCFERTGIFDRGGFSGILKEVKYWESVLFTETECLILSSDFKLPDENQVMLKIPIKDNMYSFDLKNIVPSKGIEKPIGIIGLKSSKVIMGLSLRIKIRISSIIQKGLRGNTTMLELHNKMELVVKERIGTLLRQLETIPPIISFMRPFGCRVSILNTLDHLGKYDGKADEGVLVGYSISSKAFRVYNHKTRKVEENLHVNFLENQPNIAGNGPKWLVSYWFLTNTMNYHPVSAGNRANVNAGIETNSDAGQAEKEKVPDQEYILLPLLHTTNEEDHTLKDDVDDMLHQEKMATKHPDDARSQFELECDAQLCKGLRTRTSSTNSFNTVRTPLNTPSASRTSYPARTSSKPQLMPIDGSFSIDINDYPDNPLMPELEDIGEIHSTGIFGNAYDDSPNTPIDDQMKPKKVNQALDDVSWVESMQEELLQFKLLNVWTLVDLPKGKKAIGTKWVFKNKKDQREIVVRNKARLVAQGHRQEEGIDYDEVFAPVARIEAIRLFLAYASYMDFTVYQMDVKSAFLYGTIEEEVYVNQPPGFEDPEFPNKVYKVEKALYGLHQAPRAWYETLSTYLLENGFRRGDDIIFGSTKKSLSTEFEKLMHKRFQMSSMGELTFFLGLQVEQRKDGIFLSQDKYVYDILKKFGFTTVKTTSTPMEIHKSLSSNAAEPDVDVYLYRSMIGHLDVYISSQTYV